MKLRDFVTDEQIALNFKGRETLPIWDSEFSEEDVARLSDAEYLARLEYEHREFQAWMTARYGNSKYRPDELARKIDVPELHIWAFLALQGRTGKGIY